MAKMTKEELKVLVDSHVSQCESMGNGELAVWRKKATDYYSGDAVGELAPPDIEGRSSVVSPDVRNTIEAMLPQLMVKFVGGDSVVEFTPAQRDDEAKAKLCTAYLNHLFFKSNGHKVCYDWFKDALLYKNGIVKAWWDTRSEQTREEYLGLSNFELAQLLDDPEVEPKEQSERPDEEDEKQREQALAQLQQQLVQAMQQQQPSPQPGQTVGPQSPVDPAVQQIQQRIAQIQAQPPVMLYDIVVERSKKGGKVSIENVPPEEFFISSRAKSIETAAFCGHRFMRTVSELRSMGYEDLDDLAGLDFTSDEAIDDDATTDESQRTVWVREAYMRVDFDGDGISELRKVVYTGDKILDNEVVDVAPFVSICPIPVPHKFFGLCPADLAMGVQKSKTSVLRSLQDNLHLQVNGRYFAVEGQVTLDDLLTSRPGGIVRMKQPNMAGRLDQGAGDLGASMRMLEHLETMLETSTGWTRYSQGNGPGPLQGTATGMNIITNKDDMRLDLIARNFAEGFTALFCQLLKMVCQHQNRRVEARIADEWVDIDPREWRNGFGVQINVGLGVGNKDQRIQHLMMLLQHQANVLPLGVTDPQGIYEASIELARLQGFKTGTKYFTDPAQQGPRPTAPNPEMEKLMFEREKFQVGMNADVQKFQAQTQAEAAKSQTLLQVEQAKMEMQAQVDQNRQQMEAGQQQLKAQAEAEVARYKADLDAQIEAGRAQTQIYIEQLRIEAQDRRAQLEAETKLAIAQSSHGSHAAQMPQIPFAEAGFPAAGAIGLDQTTEPALPVLDRAEDPIRDAVRASLRSEVSDPAALASVQATPVNPAMDPAVLDTIQTLLQKVEALESAKSQPIKFIRDDEGRATAFDVGGVVRSIQRGDDGRMSQVI